MTKLNKCFCLILIVVCVIATSLYIPNCNYKDNTVYAAGTREVTCVVATLNIRKGPGTTYDKVQVNGVNAYMKQGDKATVTSEEKGWFGISFTFDGKKIEGFISADYVEVTEIPDEEPKNDPNPADDKKNDNKDAEEPKQDPADQTSEGVTVVNEEDGTVTVDGVTYIVEDGVYYNTFSCKGRVTADALRVRKGPGTDSKQITVNSVKQSLVRDQVITILEKVEENGDLWYKVQYKADKKKVTGYVSADYVTLEYKKGKAFNVKGVLVKNAYIRTTTAMTKKTILKYKDKKVSYSKGKKVEIIGESTADGEKWYKIQFYSGKKLLEGYLRADYVDFRLTKASVQPKPVVIAEPEPEIATEPAITSEGAISVGDGQGTEVDNTTFLMKSATVIGGPVELRIAPGFGYSAILDGYGLPRNVNTGTVVTTYSLEIDAEANKWLLVTYEQNGVLMAGYLPFANLTFDTIVEMPSDITGFTNVLSESEFEIYMSNQGFPESYKPFLRALHTAHPYWEFRADHLGLDWTTALDNESVVGWNLITNSKNIAWKSLEENAYDWTKDKFRAYDGSTWVTASRDAVAYFMDPRNFLNDTEIYQFELLSYQPGYQTVVGIEEILANTPMHYSSYGYTDEYGNWNTITYSDTFMQAAEHSGVSPYHLASRAKQEVVTGFTTMSSSVSGTVAGYEGLYNFYNIGATQSTAKGGSVANGLSYASKGNPDTKITVNGVVTFLNDYIMIPWTSPYRSIIGGGAYIGVNYIQRGQNTVYLEKFNMTPISTYGHQYMSNVEAAQAESIKTAAAYKSMVSTPLIFSIPVYLNMPEEICGKPVDVLNPNNWLKTLEISGYSLTPSFDPSEDQVYSVIVENDVTEIVVTGKTASSKASVTGLGEVLLEVGSNTVPIIVTAENGDSRVYIINVVRLE